MQINYHKIVNFIVKEGDMLAKKAGKVKDIGKAKRFLTAYDLKIERGLKKIITSFGNKHSIFAEEENEIFKKNKHIWAIDPISGTHQFIAGKKHYSIVVCHLENKRPKFAAIYDPTEKKLYTAYEKKGAFLNGAPLYVSKHFRKILLKKWFAWKNPKKVSKITKMFKHKKLIINPYSMGLNYCWVASGKYDGIISFSKDSFPEFAGQLIINEAGGKFTNLKGDEYIDPKDRIFIGGNMKAHQKLLNKIKKLES